MASFRVALGFLAAFAAPLVSAAPSTFSPVKCPVVKDGRIPQTFTLKDFDNTTSPFDPNYSKGQNLSWSQIAKFPRTDSSRFDFVSAHNTTKPVEVTITDQSIFVPGGGAPQLGFRRAGFLMGNGTDETTVGVKTFHWSSKQPQPSFSQGFTSMNLTHEYMNAWHERNDYTGNQFSINAGVLLSQDYPANCSTSSACTATEKKLPKKAWKFLDHGNNVVFVTPILYDQWQNFAVTLDYDKK